MDSEVSVDELFFDDIVMHAEIQSILEILKEVCRQAGVTGPDGISIEDWFVRQKHVEIERVFGLLEHKDSEFAARLRQRYCKNRRC